jgi:hypothetical protein
MDIRKQEHLTPAQLVEAKEYCMGIKGGRGCAGCPNAGDPFPLDDDMCYCVFDMNDEELYWLKQLVKMQGGEENA